MNIKWMIIAVIGLLIFIAMGNNPFEAPKGYVYEDPVKKSLRERAGGKTDAPTIWGGTSGNTRSSGLLNMPSSTKTGFPTTGSKAVLPPAPAPTPAPTQPAIPNQPTPFQNLPTAPSTETLPPGATLYSPPYVPKHTLASGQPLRFVGIYAFTQDENGQIVRVKDGVYTTKEGITITIKDGVNRWQPPKWFDEERRI
jgi:hypothetical protein